MRKLRVELSEGKNFKPADLDGKADRGSKKQHFKSRVVKNTLHPEWNEEFDFNIEPNAQHTLQVEVFDKDVLTKDDFLGRCEVAVATITEGKVHTVWLPLEGGGNAEIKLKIHLSDANGLFTNYAVASTPADPNAPPSHATPFSYMAPPNTAPPQKIANLNPSNQNPNNRVIYAVPRNAPQSVTYEAAPTPSNAVYYPSNEAPSRRSTTSYNTDSYSTPSYNTPSYSTPSYSTSSYQSASVPTPSTAPKGKATTEGTTVSAQHPKIAEAAAAEVARTILDYCQRNNVKWEDPDFPAADSSLYKNGRGDGRRIEWRRPNEIAPQPRLFVDGVESGDVIQGALGDCYFLGALSVVATRRDLLLPLFVSANERQGFYQIRFWKNDDRIPCYGGRPLYSHCKDKNEMWVPLMEKAYAKLHRCYEALDTGSLAAALTDLTGESCQVFNFDDNDVMRSLYNGAFWKQLLYFIDEQFLMGCTYNTGQDGEEMTSLGILKNHAYGLLDAREVENNKLISIRNPWGHLEWKGRFSDNSTDWTPSLIQALNVKFEDDGTFWMCFDDFVKQYTTVFVLTLLTDDIGKKWERYVFEDEWDEKTSGGCTNYPSFTANPQYGITVRHPNTKVFLSLSQPDQRLLWNAKYQFSLGINLMKTKDAKRKKLSFDNSDIVARMSYLNARDVSMMATLQPGEYVAIPATFDPHQYTKFWFTIYSENPITIEKIADAKVASVRGEWRGKTAGGCYNHPTWINNPKFLLSPAAPIDGMITVTITLKQQRDSNLAYLGLYMCKWEGMSRLDKRAVHKLSEPCINRREIAKEITIPSYEFPFVILPHTFDPEELGFELSAHSYSVPMKLEPLY